MHPPGISASVVAGALRVPWPSAQAVHTREFAAARLRPSNPRWFPSHGTKWHSVARNSNSLTSSHSPF